MKTGGLIPSALLSIALVGAAGLAAPAQATSGLVNVKFSNLGSLADQTKPGHSRDRFVQALDSGYVTEDFESFEIGTRQGELATVAGTFSQQVAGRGGLCRTLAGGCAGGVSVLDDALSPYDDRYATSGTQWLDNTGTRLLRFTPIAGINAIGFFATDLGDPTKPIDVKIATGGKMVDLSHFLAGVDVPNGALRYVTFTSHEDITDLWIQTNENKEGYGLDDFTVGRKTRGICTPR